MKHLPIASRVLIVAASTVLSATWQPASAITFDFRWAGAGGYSVQGIFSYDENLAPAIIAEAGAGPTAYLESLSVAFFDPSNHPTQSFNTVVAGISGSSFFQFNFDTTTRSLFGPINIGGGTGVIGEQFFTGTLGDLLRLRQDIDQIGQSFELDRQEVGTIEITEVPEASTSAALFAGGALFSLAVFRSTRGRPYSTL